MPALDTARATLVIPAQAGIQHFLQNAKSERLDSGLRRNDEENIRLTKHDTNG
jgi:hypothetical protein